MKCMYTYVKNKMNIDGRCMVTYMVHLLVSKQKYINSTSICVL